MKNTLMDLNNHLFARLERLNDDSVTGDALKEEIARAQAVTTLAREIVGNGALMLKARVVAHEMGGAGMPKALMGGE